MHILIITNHFWPEDFRINEIAESLIEKGHSISVLTGIPNYPQGNFFEGYGLFKKRREVRKGIVIRRIPLIPRGKGSHIGLIANYTSSLLSFCIHAPFQCREKYDVVFVFSTSPATIGIPAILIKRIRKVPVVVWVLDLWPDSLSAAGAIKKNSVFFKLVSFLIKTTYKQSDKILVSSRGFVQSIESLAKIKSPPIYFPNWIEKQVAEGDSDRNYSTKLPVGFNIVFTGNIGVAQDFPTLLDAAEKLRDYDDIHWNIIGDGRQLKWVQTEIERRGISKTFHILGRFPADQMNSFYDRADVLLLPLKDEAIFALTAPGKLQSYLSSGKPILGSIRGEAASIIEDAKCGVVAPPSSPKQLAQKVLELYRLPKSQMDEMGRNGQLYCTEHFSRDRLMARLESELLNVVDSCR